MKLNDEKTGDSIRKSNVRAVAETLRGRAKELGEQAGKSSKYIGSEEDLAKELRPLKGKVEGPGELVEAFQNKAQKSVVLQEAVFKPLREEIDSSSSLRDEEIDVAVSMLQQHFWSRFYKGLEERGVIFEEVAEDIFVD